MNLRPWVFGLALVLPMAAQAQPQPPAQQDIAPALRGTYAAPSCADPAHVLHVTARSLLRMERGGTVRLYRGQSIATQNGWTILNGTGPESPRITLRAAGQNVDEVIPDAKLRDDQLPGDTQPLRYARCTEAPAALAAQAEGIAFLHNLEAMEPACQNGPTQACLEAFLAQADVSGDGTLSTAEVARVVRGAVWTLQVLDGARLDDLAAGYLGSVTLGTSLAQILVQAYDYDNSGTLSLAELTRDRQPFPLVPGARSAAAPPVPLDSLLQQMRPLRSGLTDVGRFLFGHRH